MSVARRYEILLGDMPKSAILSNVANVRGVHTSTERDHSLYLRVTGRTVFVEFSYCVKMCPFYLPEKRQSAILWLAAPLGPCLR